MLVRLTRAPKFSLTTGREDEVILKIRAAYDVSIPKWFLKKTIEFDAEFGQISVGADSQPQIVCGFAGVGKGGQRLHP